MNLKSARLALVSYYPDMHKGIYQQCQDRNITPLYFQTALKELFEQSPLLIELLPQDPLISVLPQRNTLFFHAPDHVSVTQMISHLRERMNVVFDGELKGLFHYYLPEVASYFFCHSQSEDTHKWLGCMTGISLNRQTLTEPPEWVEIIGDDSFSEEKRTWLLTQSQSDALTRHAMDKTALSDNSTPENTPIQHSEAQEVKHDV